MRIYDDHTNIFKDGEVAGYNPDADRDYYLIADAQRDHEYWQSKVVEIFRQLSANPTTTNYILYGGTVTDAGGGQININAGAAVGHDTAGSARLISWDTQSAISIPAGWNDNRQIWTVAKYLSHYGTTTRAHKAATTSYHVNIVDGHAGYSTGSEWFYESAPSQVILGSFKMNGALYSDQAVRSTMYTFISSIVPAGDVSTLVPKDPYLTMKTLTAANTVKVDWADYNKAECVLDRASTDFDFTAPALPTTMLLLLRQDTAGSRLATWPSATVFAGGSKVLTTTGLAEDIINIYWDGTKYYATVLNDFKTP